MPTQGHAVQSATSTPGIDAWVDVPTNALIVVVVDLGLDQVGLPTHDQSLESVPHASAQDPAPMRKSSAGIGSERAASAFASQTSWQSVAGPHARKHRKNASQSGDRAHVSTLAQVVGLLLRQLWHAAALAAGPSRGARPPQVRPHASPQFDAMHVSSLETEPDEPVG